MIPKIIHYCWFGKNPLPKFAIKCITSWKKYLPDYEIKEWNEDNFDVDIIPFTREAYNVKKFAYVSDYARLWIIYNHGGIYFDTDVEVIREMDNILQKGAYMSFEKHIMHPEIRDYVNPGLGFAAQTNNSIIKEIMSYYENNHYILKDGTLQQIPIVPITTNVLRKHGLKESSEPFKIDDNFTIYPWEYFCPIEYLSKKMEITDKTYTIHHYTESWMSTKDKFKMRKGVFFNKGVGKWVKNIVRKKPGRIRK